MFQAATPENSALRVYFSHADGMRSANHEPITGFEIADALKAGDQLFAERMPSAWEK